MAPISESDNQHTSFPPAPLPTATPLQNKRTPSKQVVKSDFAFFNISHPSEVKSTQRRKQVRSHVTQQQHRRRRMPPMINIIQRHAESEASLLAQRHKRKSPPMSTMLLEFAEDSSVWESKSRKRNASLSSSGTSTESSLDSDMDASIRQRLDLLLTATPYPVPHPSSHTIRRNDPFTRYQIQWQPFYDRLLHHMMTIFAPRGWPSLKITNEQGGEWEYFMTQKAMAEPALLYVRLLFASGDLVRLGVLERERTYPLNLHAIKAINEALSHPERSVSDGLILAVGRIALHEFMYGDRAAANQIHRPAQRRMIDLRGGMMNLGFPDLVKRLMRWADNVMSIQSNTDRLLPDDEDRNNETYNMQQSLNVLEAWAPETGLALRKRVEVATFQRQRSRDRAACGD